MVSYLPRDLYLHLDKSPSTDPEEVSEFDPSLFLRDLAEFGKAGYYRLIVHLVYCGRFRVKIDHVRYLADLFCAMNPFNENTARKITYSFMVDWEARNHLAELCVMRGNVTAARFVVGTFCEHFRGVRDALHLLEFLPGYVETLLVNPALIDICGCTPYVLPSTYDVLEQKKLLCQLDRDYTIMALVAGNYRLARHIKATHAGKQTERGFMFDLTKVILNRKYRRDREILAWMQQEGWISGDMPRQNEKRPDEADIEYNSS